MIKSMPLNEFLSEYTERNIDNKYKPVAVGRYGIRSRDSIYSKELAKDYSKNKLIFKNTLTIGMGSVQIDIGILSTDETYSVSPAYHTYRINNINPNYLRYCLECRNQDMFVRYVKKGSRQGKTIDLSRWLAYEIPVYSIEDQEKIVDKIDRVQGIIDASEKQLVKLDELVKSRFVEMFGELELNQYGWKYLPLSALVTIEPQNGLYKPQSDYVRDDSGVPILRIDAFYDGKVTDFSKLRRLICSSVERERYLLRENDIVINRVNSIEYLGKCAHITGMLEDTVFESNMMRFHLDESVIEAGFAVHLLCTKYIHKQIMNRAKKAVNQASINQGDVMSLQLLVPPLTLQKQFIAFVEQVDKSKFRIQKSLSTSRKLWTLARIDAIMNMDFSTQRSL